MSDTDSSFVDTFPDAKPATRNGEISPVRVYDYVDYRSYLRDVYLLNKARDRRWSCRFIASRVGFRSASYFTQVLGGRTHLTPSMALRFAGFLRLDRRECDYLELLVLLARSRTNAEKKRYLEKLSTFREASMLHVPPEHFAFFEKWWHAALRESLHVRPFDGRDFRMLGRRLRPSIPAAEARASIELLVQLGMARQLKDGTVVRADQRSTTTGEAVQAVQVDSFHDQCLGLAREAIDGLPRNQRALSSLTFSLSSAGREAIAAEIVEFRRRVLAIAEADEAETAVYHLGIQFFPMTVETPRG